MPRQRGVKRRACCLKIATKLAWMSQSCHRSFDHQDLDVPLAAQHGDTYVVFVAD
jgi:hypothetical protein